MQRSRHVAVLIDSDNVASPAMTGVLARCASYGTLSVRRAYGDFTSPALAPWKQHLHEHAIHPVQQFAYTTGKNATDSALIIDAMDLLHLSEVEVFCLVSSDSDFTRLAGRLREAAKRVVGFGENKAPAAFRAACDEFVLLGSLSSPPIAKPGGPPMKGAEPKPRDGLTGWVHDAIAGTAGPDGWAHLSAIGAHLVEHHPGFEPKRYGHSKLSVLLQGMSGVQLRQSGKGSQQVLVRLAKKAKP